MYNDANTFNIPLSVTQTKDDNGIIIKIKPKWKYNNELIIINIIDLNDKNNGNIKYYWIK